MDEPLPESFMSKSKLSVSENRHKDARTSPGFAAKIVGWLSRRASRASLETAADDPKPALGFFYASQTGNAENLARDAAALAERLGLKVQLSALDEVDIHDLNSLEKAVFFVSTYGEGDMPDNGQLFWETASASEAPRLDGLHFAVLALGNSTYRDFCRAGKQLDLCLERLGATRLLARLDCDVDYEEPASAWINSTLAAMTGQNAQTLATVGADAGQPSASERHSNVQATLVARHRLTGAGAEKAIHHIELDFANTVLAEQEHAYAAGDTVAIRPVNDPELVNAIITWLDVKPDRLVDGKPLNLLLAHEREIRPPSLALIKAIAERSKDETLRTLFSRGDELALGELFRDGDAVDVLSYASSASLSAEELIGLLKPLQHRHYSISSSPLVALGRVHLTVGAVAYSRGQRHHRGTCSHFLSDRLSDGAGVDMMVVPNRNFRLPTDLSAPIIMVGPGTGIAPFRAFLQERRATGASGRNWLFFGNRHQNNDFIYQDEIVQHARAGG